MTLPAVRNLIFCAKCGRPLQPGEADVTSCGPFAPVRHCRPCCEATKAFAVTMPTLNSDLPMDLSPVTQGA